MHDYIKKLYEEAHTDGSPLIRTMFYEFPGDAKCWDIQDQYMFGDRYLCAPVFTLHAVKRDVYLPAGKWQITSTGEVFEGGQTVHVDAPIDYMPVFCKLQ
jgi:alpha-D-xyloside xylohydrolase